MRNLAVFGCIFIGGILYGCATPEPSGAGEPVDEPEEISAEEGYYPSGYTPGKLGEASGGDLYGFGTALGTETGWTIENAARQAKVNLRSWMDEQLEEARSRIVESDERAADREFIIDLRNSVVGLELTETPQQQEIIEENGSIRVWVRIHVSVSEVLEVLDRQLEPYDEIWNKMKDSGLLRSWETP